MQRPLPLSHRPQTHSTLYAPSPNHPFPTSRDYTNGEEDLRRMEEGGEVEGERNDEEEEDEDRDLSFDELAAKTMGIINLSSSSSGENLYRGRRGGMDEFGFGFGGSGEGMDWERHGGTRMGMEVEGEGGALGDDEDDDEYAWLKEYESNSRDTRPQHGIMGPSIPYRDPQRPQSTHQHPHHIPTSNRNLSRPSSSTFFDQTRQPNQHSYSPDQNFQSPQTNLQQYPPIPSTSFSQQFRSNQQQQQQQQQRPPSNPHPNYFHPSISDPNPPPHSNFNSNYPNYPSHIPPSSIPTPMPRPLPQQSHIRPPPVTSQTQPQVQTQSQFRKTPNASFKPPLLPQRDPSRSVNSPSVPTTSRALSGSANYDGKEKGKAVDRGFGGSGTGRVGKAQEQQEEEDYFGDEDESFELELSNREDLFSGALTKSNVTSSSSTIPIKPMPIHFNSTKANRSYPSGLSNQSSFNSQQRSQPSNANASGSGNRNWTAAAPKGIKLIPVSVLPDMYRAIFRQYGVFNAIQSTCFDSVYNSDENVVISAPTGSGKTVLFELAILRLLTSPSSPPDSKCGYMAPTKSLCTERAQDWKNKFARMGLGWEVIELTGDTQGSGSLSQARDCRIIITTPEKWDAMTRKWHSHEKILAKVRLFCIDECHFVGLDQRGAVLEVVVSRMKMLGPNTRFIALSATAPNIEDVALWIGKSRNEGEGIEEGDGDGGGATVFSFGDEFRPCKLKKIVMGYPKKDQNDFVFNNNLNHKLFDLIQKHSLGKPVLIFCSTRKGVAQAADVLAKQYKEALAKSSSNLPWPKPGRVSVHPLDKHLGTLAEAGIAFHHAGLDLQDRHFVEQGFINGSISIVCATSTLAVGVNMPAYMVIIKGAVSWVDGRFVEMSESDIIQQLGRAGRPQFENSGVACIMTDSGSQQRYEALAKSETLLESGLHRSLTEHINSEVSLETITSVPSAISWLRSTFLFVRIQQNPAHYGITRGSVSPEQALEAFCVEAVNELVKSGVVEEKPDSTLIATELGDMMSKFCISHSTFLALQALPKKSTLKTMLETIAGCSELSSIRFRAGEKPVYAKQNKIIRYPSVKVTTPADKIFILIQTVLAGTPLADMKVDSGNPVQDANLIWKDLTRIVKCLVDLCLEKRDWGVKNALELLRSVNGKSWDNSGIVLKQLEGIGEKSVKVLTEKGIRSFQDVFSAPVGDIECYLNRNPHWVHRLKQQAGKYPRFTIDVECQGESKTSTGVKVDLVVTLSVDKDPAPMLKLRGSRLFASSLIVTSDGEFVDFRRTTVETLLSASKNFKVSVILPKPSQRVFLSLACDDIGGSEAKAIYSPTSKAADYPVPLIRGSTPEPDGEGLDVDPPLQERKLVKSVGVKAPSATFKATPKPQPPAAPAPVKLANGKYACNHACADKTKCRHGDCCREGLDKPPKKAKSKAQTSSGPALQQVASTSKTVKKLQSGQQPLKKKSKPVIVEFSSSSSSSPPAPGRPATPLRKGTDLTLSWLDASSDDELLPSASDILAAAKSNKEKRKKRPIKRAPPAPLIVDEVDELASPSPSPPPDEAVSEEELPDSADHSFAAAKETSTKRASVDSTPPQDLDIPSSSPSPPPKRLKMSDEPALFLPSSPRTDVAEPEEKLPTTAADYAGTEAGVKEDAYDSDMMSLEQWLEECVDIIG